MQFGVSLRPASSYIFLDAGEKRFFPTDSLFLAEK